MNTPYDYINFMSYASYRPLLRKWSILDQKSNSLGIEHKKLRNSTEKGIGMIKKKKEKVRKNWKHKNHWSRWGQSTGSSGLGFLKGSHAHFSTLFSSILQGFSLVLEIWGLWRLVFSFWVVFSSFNVSQLASTSILLHSNHQGFRCEPHCIFPTFLGLPWLLEESQL